MIRQPINLVSDTVTKPTAGMLAAMMKAEVGDDVFGTDPTTNAFEARVAKMFGHEAALFCPSGTMTNQLAIKAQTQPLDEILCDELSHIYRYELGGYGFHSGVAIHVIRGNRGIISEEMIRQGVKPKADWNPTTKLLCLENSINMGGGNYYSLDQIKSLVSVAREYGLRTHLDGARLFNVLVETGDSTQSYGEQFNSISICFSKGLGAPIGSVLISDAETIAYARRVRKVFGGGMRQTGYLTAACDYALDHHVDRLKEDHTRARKSAEKLKSVSWAKEVFPVFTNIVIFQVPEQFHSSHVVEFLRRNNILCSAVNEKLIRWVFHLDITDDMMHDILRLPEQMS